MRYYAPLAVLIAIFATQAIARAQNCWTPVKNWGGSYSLSGYGKNTCNGATETTDEGATAMANVPLWSVTCAGVTWFGGPIFTDKVNSITLNDKSVISCDQGESTWSMVGSGGAVASSFLLIPASGSTYQFAVDPWENDAVIGMTGDCGSFPPENLGFKVSVAPLSNPSWPPTFSLPSKVQPLTAKNYGFQGQSGNTYQCDESVPWKFSFALKPNYDCKPCKQKGGQGTASGNSVPVSSSIGPQNQSLGEDEPVVGTGFDLHYESSRAPGAAADSVATSDAAMLGGWTLSVHHAYAPDSNTLYLGDGSQRRGAELGNPVIDFLNGDTLVTSEDGGEVYDFDLTTGRHVKTVKPLTGAVIYQFGYDSAGNLVTVTDATNNVTTIQRDASEHPTAIVSPYEQTTQLSLDTNGFLNKVTDPLGKSETFTNTSSGLLTARTDENGNLFTYRYDS